MTRPDPYELGRQAMREAVRRRGLPDELEDPAVIARLVALFAGALNDNGPAGNGAAVHPDAAKREGVRRAG